MNEAHLHLIFNHVPVIGAPLCLLLLMYGIALREITIQRAALLLCVVIALLTIPVYYTGDPAGKIVEKMQGVSRGAIHPHEERAEISFVSMNVTGALALFVFFLGRRRGAEADEGPRDARRRAATIFVAAALVVSATLMASTAYLGGRIRHPETRMPVSGEPPPSTAPTAVPDDDD